MKKYIFYLIIIIIAFSGIVLSLFKNLGGKNFTLAQLGGSGSGSLGPGFSGGGNRTGLGNGSSASYSLDYCGNCNGLYCYNGPANHVCPTESSIRSSRQYLLYLRDEILYYKNRVIAEKDDLLLEISHLDEFINYYQEKIEAGKKIMEQFTEQGAKDLEQAKIKVFEEKRAEAEKDKTNKQEIIKHFDEIIKLIESIGGEIMGISEKVDKCINEGVKECKPICSGGCHDTTGCFPGSQGGMGGLGGMGGIGGMSGIGGGMGGLGGMGGIGGMSGIGGGMGGIGGMSGIGGGMSGIGGGMSGIGRMGGLGGMSGGKNNECSGGTPSVCGIGYSYSVIVNLRSKINSEIQVILDLLGGKITTTAAPTTTIATSTATSTEQQLREELAAAGIKINKNCVEPSSCSVSGGQTCVAGLQQTTIDGVKTIKQNSNCDITITGGTECGHSTSGTYNHANGYKTDLRPNSCLNNYIAQQGCTTAMVNQNCRGKDGNIYRYEVDHWDVCYGCL